MVEDRAKWEIRRHLFFLTWAVLPLKDQSFTLGKLLDLSLQRNMYISSVAHNSWIHFLKCHLVSSIFFSVSRTHISTWSCLGLTKSVLITQTGHSFPGPQTEVSLPWNGRATIPCSDHIHTRLLWFTMCSCLLLETSNCSNGMANGTQLI